MNKKVITLIITIVLIVIAYSAPVFANLDSAMSQMKGVTNVSGNSQMVSMGNKVIGVVYYAGIVVAVGMVMISGIRFMMASPDEKASIKKQSIPFLIGAILVFSAVNVMKIVGNMTEWIK